MTAKPREITPEDIASALGKPARLRADCTQIGISIPRAHMRVLEVESNFLGLRRSQLLELLFLNALGQNAIVRLPMAPTYELRRDELAETVKYFWLMRKEVKKLVDEYMLRTGLKTSGWIVMALNEWAGLASSKQGG